MPFNDCDHADKVLAFLLIGEKIEQMAAAVLKERERRREGEEMLKNEGTLKR